MKRLDDLTAAILSYLWQRFLLLGWIGKSIAVIVLLYGAGWLLGGIGWDSAARGLGGFAIYLLGLLVTALVIRGIWRATTAHHGR